MIGFEIKHRVEIDIDGWAATRQISAGEALVEALAFLRGINPVAGQTYAVPITTDVRMLFDLGTPAPRCEHNARRGTGTGTCNAVLDQYGRCAYASGHID